MELNGANIVLIIYLLSAKQIDGFLIDIVPALISRTESLPSDVDIFLWFAVVKVYHIEGVGGGPFDVGGGSNGRGNTSESRSTV